MEIQFSMTEITISSGTPIQLTEDSDPSESNYPKKMEWLFQTELETLFSKLLNINNNSTNLLVEILMVNILGLTNLLKILLPKNNRNQIKKNKNSKMKKKNSKKKRNNQKKNKKNMLKPTEPNNKN